MGDALSDPGGSGALVAAAQWLQGTLLGTLATTVAIIAIAVLGFGMLTGRIDVRRGVTVVLGCFILFGAPTIAAGLMRLGDMGNAPFVETATPVAPPPVFATPMATPYDPYAGASVPRR